MSGRWNRCRVCKCDWCVALELCSYASSPSGDGFCFFRGGACSNFGSFSFGSGCFVSLLLAALCSPQHNCVFFNEIPNDIGAFEWPVVTDIDIFILEV
ncbi:hypothetical protein P8452_25524 [Trifolium repens]|nr:hypothetical protein P8452_03846 [Trifolium repens]WJX25189.1 hypothetical protein P8452_14252 [Trifolium repens]WJX37796.1 hypothetical protein P8452_25524 [Trifolium repens]